MVRRLVILGLVVALATSYLYFRESRARVGPVAKTAVLQQATAAGPSAVAMTQPAVRTEPQTAQQQRQPVTADRRRILDSEDVLATIRAVQKDGDADEKEWARSLLSACVLLDVEPPKPSADGAGPPPTPNPPASTLHVEQKKRASEILHKRCSGVIKLDKTERAALKSALKDDPTETPTSPLQKMGVMIKNPDSRWSDEQNQLVTKSLYGGDPILQRTALLVLLQGNDFNAPGGADRQAALISVLGANYSSATLSEFEALQECITFGDCEGERSGSQPPQPPTPAIRVLEAKYENALAKQLDARGILSIR